MSCVVRTSFLPHVAALLTSRAICRDRLAMAPLNTIYFNTHPQPMPPCISQIVVPMAWQHHVGRFREGSHQFARQAEEEDHQIQGGGTKHTLTVPCDEEITIALHCRQADHYHLSDVQLY